MITGDDRWFQVCKRVNDAVFAELDSKPCRSGVVPGLVAWDDCSCGILATTWAIIMASEVFPQEVVGIDGNCDAPWEVIEIAVQLIRCSPSPVGQALAPPVQDLVKAARQLDIDVSQTVRASSVLLCGMKDAYDIADYMIGRTSSIGPEGGCVGFELRMYAALPRLTAKV